MFTNLKEQGILLSGVVMALSLWGLESIAWSVIYMLFTFYTVSQFFQNWKDFKFGVIFCPHMWVNEWFRMRDQNCPCTHGQEWLGPGSLSNLLGQVKFCKHELVCTSSGRFYQFNGEVPGDIKSNSYFWA